MVLYMKFDNIFPVLFDYIYIW